MVAQKRAILTEILPPALTITKDPEILDLLLALLLTTEVAMSSVQAIQVEAAQLAMQEPAVPLLVDQVLTLKQQAITAIAQPLVLALAAMVAIPEQQLTEDNLDIFKKCCKFAAIFT